MDIDHVLANTRDLWEPVRGSRIFLTGGTGFVGTWLTDSFARANKCLALDARMTVLSRNPPQVSAHEAVTYLKGNCQTFEFPRGDFGYVIHAATERQFPPDAEHPLGMFDADTQATRRMLEFSREHGTRRFLFTSSGAVYGRQPRDVARVSEDYAGAPSTCDSQAAYGHAKRAGEWLCTMYSRQNGFEATIARLFAFVGPHLPLDRNFAVGNFIGDLLKGDVIRVSGDGTPYRSYLYAADMAIWLWTVLLRGESARPYNVGSPDALTIVELAGKVAGLAAPQARVEVASQPLPGTVAARYVPDTSRAERELGLQVLIPLDEALRRTFEWYGARA